MSFRLVLRSAAKADLRQSFAWYEDQQAGLGKEFLDAVEQKLMQVEENPLQFPVVRNATRRAIVKRFPFGIFLRSAWRANFRPGRDAPCARASALAGAALTFPMK